VDGAYVSGGLFATLGIETVAGRAITPADDVRGGGPDGHVAVISYRMWQQRFGRATDVLGRQLALNGVRFTVIGIAPPRFLGPEVGQATDVFVPLASEAAIRGAESALDGRMSWWLQIIARLRPDQSVDAAAAALDAVRPAIRDATLPPTANADYLASYLQTRIPLVPAATGPSNLRTRFEQPLIVVMAVVGAVLLIACANLATLMLARASARRHELSVRLALGASRTRLGCQLLVESLILAAAGGAAGLAVAKGGAALLLQQLGSDVTAVALDVSIDRRVLAFTAGVSLAVTFLFGLAPALGLGSIEPEEALKEGSRAVAGERRAGARNAFVVAQVALSFALIAAAGLFLRTFTTLATTPLGFDPSMLTIVRVEAAPASVAAEDRIAFAERVEEVAAAVPGVARASLSYLTPLSQRNWTHRVQVFDGPALPPARQVTWVNAVAPGWFETYGMRLLAGRALAPSDRAGSERVAVVNEAFVRRFTPDRNPLGARIRNAGLGNLQEHVVVGIVSDAVYRTARIGVVPTMYLPMAQANVFGSGFSITARIASDRAAVERGLVSALGSTVPDLSFSIRDYREQIRATLVQERLVALLSAFFGGLALLLAALGLYGVTSYSVGRRRPELAVRLALGASRGSVLRLVLGRVAALLLAGTLIGLAASMWAATFVGSLLFGLGARDPLTLVAAGVVLAAVGLSAAWLAARKASRMDPAVALRG
jgi:predicted permease